MHLGDIVLLSKTTTDHIKPVRHFMTSSYNAVVALILKKCSLFTKNQIAWSYRQIRQSGRSEPDCRRTTRIKNTTNSRSCLIIKFRQHISTFCKERRQNNSASDRKTDEKPVCLLKRTSHQKAWQNFKKENEYRHRSYWRLHDRIGALLSTQTHASNRLRMYRSASTWKRQIDLSDTGQGLD